MLPLTFADPKDYDKVPSNGTVSIIGLQDFAPGRKLYLYITRRGQLPEIVEVCNFCINNLAQSYL